MTSNDDRVSDVTAFAAANPFLYQILVENTDLHSLGLDEARREACSAAREHLRAQRFPLLRACHDALFREMKGLIKPTKQLRYRAFPHIYFPWAPGSHIEFWVWHSEAVVKQYNRVPLLVTLSTDMKGRHLDRVAAAVHAATGQEPVRMELWRPRVVWRAVALTEDTFEAIAQRAVEGIREVYSLTCGALGDTP